MRRHLKTFRVKNHAPQQFIDEAEYNQRGGSTIKSTLGPRGFDTYFRSEGHTVSGSPDTPLFLRSRTGGR